MTDQNPSPEDFSLFEELPDPIKVPAETALTVGQEVLNGTLRIPSLPVTIENGVPRIDLQPVRIDQGTTGKGVNPDAPENGLISNIGEFSNLVNKGFSGTGFGNDLLGEFGIGRSRGANFPLKIKGGKDAKSINRKTVFGADLSQVRIDPKTNELNTFSSYTYNIALYMLDSRSYVNLLTRPSSPQEVLSDSLLLMRSGSVGTQGRDSSKEQVAGFADNFFIDDLELENIAVGPSKFKQNTNAVNVRFNILEPRGVTLLERLQSAAASTLTSGERYIHVPYLLEITFKGYDDSGQPLPSPSLPKYIPIRITDITFDVSEMGTQYKVQAIPFAHHLFGSITSTIPVNIELKANSIGNIFTDGVQQINQQTDKVRTFDEFGDATVVEQTKEVLGEKSANLGEVLTKHQIARTKPTYPPVDKDQGGYDAIPSKPIPPDAELYDTYSFLIADEIANSTLYVDELFDALATPQAKGETKNDGKKNLSQFESYVQGLTGQIKLDKKTQIFTINAGTDVVKLMNLLIMHSSYIEQNVRENAVSGQSTGGPIKWFKIKPVILSADGPGTGFDKKDGRYKYHIQFVIEPSTIYYHDFPWAPKSAPNGTGVHKIYDYIYSGKNTEVLSFDMKFRTAFMQVMTAGTGSIGNKNTSSHFQPLAVEQPFSVEGNTINGRDSVQRARAKDLFSSVMSDGVDMVDLNMQIIGDPAYLPTSDAYWQDRIRDGEQYTTAFMPDGTINYDLSPPYIQVNLKTPVDYDETTGLANPSQLGNSAFSGVYKLYSVESVFSGGQFTQRLNGLRANIQQTPKGPARDIQEVATQERQEFDKDLVGYDEVAITAPEKNYRANNTINVRTPESTYEIDGVYDAPYSSPTVNNETTRIIGQQQEQEIPLINDPNDTSATDAWLKRFEERR